MCTLGVGIEKEIKFPLTSWEDGESRLTRAGAVLVTTRQFESNSLFDFPGGRLGGRGLALRLRRVNDRAWLTLKISRPEEQGIKVREELETVVQDPDTLAGILFGLGLEESFRYEKYRAIYRVEDADAMLDETPIGFYLELEGERPTIEAVVQRLDLPMESGITLTYPQLYERYRKDTEGAPAHMVFTDERTRR